MSGLTKVGLTAALTALGLFALTAVANATAVNPEGANWNGEAGKTSFISDNGNGAEVFCDDSTAAGVVPGPPGDSQNPPKAGLAYNFHETDGGDSQGGSVIGPVTELEFEDCDSDLPFSPTITVVTEDGFTITATAEHEPVDGHKDGDAAVAINVPPNGATINIGFPFNCAITVSNDGTGGNPPATGGVASSAIGTWKNGRKDEPEAIPSELYVKGQLPFWDSCGLHNDGESQAVFYANGREHGTSFYTVTNKDDPTQPITIDETHTP